MRIRGTWVPQRYPRASPARRPAGAAIVNVAPEYATVTIAIDPTRLGALAALPGVRSLREVTAPRIDAAGVSFAAGACSPVVTEGDTQLRADLARATHGL